jgi:hypothetical protein
MAAIIWRPDGARREARRKFFFLSSARWPDRAGVKDCAERMADDDVSV